jgi:hypothetical protein
VLIKTASKVVATGRQSIFEIFYASEVTLFRPFDPVSRTGLLPLQCLGD